MQCHDDNPRGVCRRVDYVTERKVRLAKERDGDLNFSVLFSLLLTLPTTIIMVILFVSFVSFLNHRKLISTDDAIFCAVTCSVVSITLMFILREFLIKCEYDDYVRWDRERDSNFTREHTQELLSLMRSSPLNIVIFDFSKRQKIDHVLKSGIDIMEKSYFGRSVFEYVVLCGDEDFALHVLINTGHDITNGILDRGIEILEFVVKYGTLNVFNMVKMLIIDFHPEWEGNLHDMNYAGFGILTDVSKDVIIQNLRLVELL